MQNAYSTTLILPEHSLPNYKVGENLVERFVHQSMSAQADVLATEHNDVVLVKTDKPSPFDQFYIVKHGKVNLENCADLPILKVKLASQIHSLNEKTELAWVRHPLAFFSEFTPEQITENWIGKFQFQAEDIVHNISGLRTPQIGALHAISAEFSRSTNIEPCTVVLPTGTGKTETMLSTTIYHRCQTVLVLVPSNSLRDQIGDKFKTLGCLPELGVVAGDILFPAVTKIKRGIKSVSEAKELLSKSNVVIATPQILNSKFSTPEVLTTICESCSHLFVDEAHHISAQKWSEIRDKFKGKRVVQFTATPFRNDTQSLGARIIYNYTMSEAQQAGYFTSVQLEPVEEYFENNMDKAIAEKALTILTLDRKNGFDHLMMARTKTKERAQAVYALYRKLAPELNPVLVYSTLSKTEQNRRLNELKSKKAKIVVCVDMLGEGYDLPNLKIAAIHDHHKSLAITLQFIGRFTRVSSKENLGTASAVVNIADPGIEGALQKLYAIDADWDAVLRRLSENQIEREVRLQEVVDSLKGEGDLHKQLSLWNLRPSFSAMLFQTDCHSWHPDKFAELSFTHDAFWHAISADENLLVILALSSTAVKWGNFKDVRDLNYKILMAHWDKDRNGLFIYSNDYKGFKAEKLAEKLCGDSTTLMAGKQIFNVLNEIEYPLVTNLGSAQNGAISFTQFFGPNVTDGLSDVERSASTLSNIAALGYENGEKVLWGCSERKGKVWSPKAGSIADWLDWVKAAYDKVAFGDTDEANITRDFLRPNRIEQPHNSKPISVQWGEQLQQRYEDTVHVYFGTTSHYLYEVDLKVDWNETTKNPVITFEAQGSISKYELEISGDHNRGYDYRQIDGETLSIQFGKSDPEPLIEVMLKDPIYVYYADGSFSYNCYWVEVKDNIGEFNRDNCTAMDWPVDITNESMGKQKLANSIQYYTWQSIENEFDIIINDDGNGEAADLVAVKSLPDKIILSLYHCKYSHGPQAGARLNDLYEVCGQAQRSVRWKHVGLPYVYRHIKQRESYWHPAGYSRFLKGNISMLESLKNRARTTPVEFQVVIVQPGMSKGKATEEMLKLLGTAELFIKKTTMADLQVWCSE